MGVLRGLQVRALLLLHLLLLLASYLSSYTVSWSTVLCGEATLLVLFCLPWRRKHGQAALGDAGFGGVPMPRFSSDLLKLENIAGITYGGCAAAGSSYLCSSLASSWCCIPHPAKAHRGGEDAVFVTPWSVGCADGVLAK